MTTISKLLIILSIIFSPIFFYFYSKNTELPLLKRFKTNWIQGGRTLLYSIILFWIIVLISSIINVLLDHNSNNLYLKYIVRFLLSFTSAYYGLGSFLAFVDNYQQQFKKYFFSSKEFLISVVFSSVLSLIVYTLIK